MALGPTMLPRPIRALGALAVSVVVATAAAALPASAAPTPVVARAAVAHTTDPCPTGATEMSFDNTAGLDAYGAITLTGNAAVTPSTLVNTSTPIADYPTDPNDPSGNTHYFCDSAWSGSGAGNFWVSIGQPIVGLPGTQPTVTEPYRWSEVEFGAPGVGGTTDFTNVNSFSFPLDMQMFATPGGTTAQESSLFSGNTCQIVGAMHTAVVQAGDGAGWGSIEQTNGGQFTRIIGPVTYNGSTQVAAWPSLSPYLAGFGATLPAGTGAYAGDQGPFVVEGYYGGIGAGRRVVLLRRLPDPFGRPGGRRHPQRLDPGRGRHRRGHAHHPRPGRRHLHPGPVARRLRRLQRHADPLVVATGRQRQLQRCLRGDRQLPAERLQLRLLGEQLRQREGHPVLLAGLEPADRPGGGPGGVPVEALLVRPRPLQRVREGPQQLLPQLRLPLQRAVRRGRQREPAPHPAGQRRVPHDAAS